MKVISFFFVSKHNKKLSNKLFFCWICCISWVFFLFLSVLPDLVNMQMFFYHWYFPNSVTKLRKVAALKLEKKKNNLKEFFFFSILCKLFYQSFHWIFPVVWFCMSAKKKKKKPSRRLTNNFGINKKGKDIMPFYQ